MELLCHMLFMKEYRMNLKRSNKQQGMGGWYLKQDIPLEIV